MSSIEITTHSPEETIELGQVVGQQLRGAEVFAIQGPLGSGKTHFIKGIALGVGADDPDQVNSPTFVLVNEYVGRLEVYHIDAYRLDSVAEFEMLGFDDFLHPHSVVLIEWADKVEAALTALDCLKLEFEHISERSRRIKINNPYSYLRLNS
jgi:tRNA threonylcarbamoyladenosine biosynthesis protein TsaE